MHVSISSAKLATKYSNTLPFNVYKVLYAIQSFSSSEIVVPFRFISISISIVIKSGQVRSSQIKSVKSSQVKSNNSAFKSRRNSSASLLRGVLVTIQIPPVAFIVFAAVAPVSSQPKLI